MRQKTRKLLFFIVPALAVFAALYQIQLIYNAVDHALAEEQSRLRDKNLVPSKKTRLTPRSADGIKIIQNTHSVRDMVDFRDSYFAATSGGLLQMSYDGNIMRHFTVVDGLPESDLTCLAIFAGKLYIGTRDKGLVEFDGEHFEGYEFTDRRAGAIRSFAISGGDLLIGTFTGGLIQFDGANFTEIRADKDRIQGVNTLLAAGTKLYVGTFGNGLWAHEGENWQHFTNADGLPSNRVVGVAQHGNDLYAATDLGLAVKQDNAFRNVAELPTLSSLVFDDKRLLLTNESGELLSFDKTLSPVSTKGGQQTARLVRLGKQVWLLSDQGISQIDGNRVNKFGDTEESLTDNFVSALSLDGEANLWVGSFQNGIDVLASDDRPIKRIQSDAIREINFLSPDGSNIAAATTNGILKFNRDFSLQSSPQKNDIPNNATTHFSRDFVATSKGLAFQDAGRTHVLTTAQGLPNNAVYTILQDGGTLYAGTLGGLVQIEDHRVVRTFTASNSGLKTNWVTAICKVNDRLFIGTYGGGLFELMPSGDIHSFEPETGSFVVNPNAMFSDGERLYIGTLGGVRILDLKTQEWRSMKDILPSETVMAITGSSNSIFFGTTSGIAVVSKNFFEKTEKKG